VSSTTYVPVTPAAVTESLMPLGLLCRLALYTQYETCSMQLGAESELDVN